MNGKPTLITPVPCDLAPENFPLTVQLVDAGTGELLFAERVSVPGAVVLVPGFGPRRVLGRIITPHGVLTEDPSE